VLDFGALPPEVNSANMFSGPGPGSLMASRVRVEPAGRRVELGSPQLRQGDHHNSPVTSGGPGVGINGPGGRTLRGLGMTTTTAQAEQAAPKRARPPQPTRPRWLRPCRCRWSRPTVLSWRSLVSTNVLGQNTGAIAAYEAQYRADVGAGCHRDV